MVPFFFIFLLRILKETWVRCLQSEIRHGSQKPKFGHSKRCSFRVFGQNLMHLYPEEALESVGVRSKFKLRREGVSRFCCFSGRSKLRGKKMHYLGTDLNAEYLGLSFKAKRQACQDNGACTIQHSLFSLKSTFLMLKFQILCFELIFIRVSVFTAHSFLDNNEVVRERRKLELFSFFVG